MEEWRQAYGVHYILDTIRVFYRYIGSITIVIITVLLPISI